LKEQGEKVVSFAGFVNISELLHAFSQKSGVTFDSRGGKSSIFFQVCVLNHILKTYLQSPHNVSFKSRKQESYSKSGTKLIICKTDFSEEK